MLWLKNRNSEVWLEQRTGYTRSSAVMSIRTCILMTVALQVIKVLCGR